MKKLIEKIKKEISPPKKPKKEKKYDITVYWLNDEPWYVDDCKETIVKKFQNHPMVSSVWFRK